MSAFEVGDRVIVQEDSDISTLPSDNCNVCGVEATMTCSGCRAVNYCTRDHQTENWKSHKKKCKEAQSKRLYYVHMHGTVVRVYDDTGTVAVDLDLAMARIKLPHTAVQQEPCLSLLVVEGQHRAAVVAGRLVEEEGKAMDIVLGCLRVVSANLFMADQNITHPGHVHELMKHPAGLLQLARITSTAWSFWNDGRGMHGTDDEGAWYHLRQYLCVETPKENPRALEDPAFQRAIKAVDDVAAVKSWNVRVHGHFWIVGMDDEGNGTFLVPDSNRNMVYQCVGVRNAIWPMVEKIHGGKCVLMTITMIPWYGRLVYDGVLMPPDGAHKPPPAPPALELRLRDTVKNAKNEGRVIGRFAQLEVEGGSLLGLHDKVETGKKSTTKKKKTQKPPKPEEQTLLDKLKAIPVTPGTYDDDNPGTSMILRRKGYTEVENPQHEVVIMTDNGGVLDFFKYKQLVPTAEDVLKALLKGSKKKKKRPIMVGIDDAEAAARVEFLLEGRVEGTTAFYYPPPTPEETAASMALGMSGLRH